MVSSPSYVLKLNSVSKWTPPNGSSQWIQDKSKERIKLLLTSKLPNIKNRSQFHLPAHLWIVYRKVRRLGVTVGILSPNCEGRVSN